MQVVLQERELRSLTSFSNPTKRCIASFLEIRVFDRHLQEVHNAFILRATADVFGDFVPVVFVHLKRFSQQQRLLIGPFTSWSGASCLQKKESVLDAKTKQCYRQYVLSLQRFVSRTCLYASPIDRKPVSCPPHLSQHHLRLPNALQSVRV